MYDDDDDDVLTLLHYNAEQYYTNDKRFRDIFSMPSSGLIKTIMTPDYGVECLYCEGSGCGWRTLVHRIGQ
jgi:hypothetical protein